MKKAFPIRDIIKIFPLIQRDTFKTWVHKGYISASYYQAEGPGEQSLYDVLDLYTIRMFSHLLDEGFSRRDASFKAKAFRNYIRSNDLVISEPIFIAFFKRPFGKGIMIRKSGPYLTDSGRLVSDKALAPGIRIITAADLDKSFKTLFLSFEDANIPKDYDTDSLELKSVYIVDFGRMKREVDSAIKEIG